MQGILNRSFQKVPECGRTGCRHRDLGLNPNGHSLKDSMDTLDAPPPPGAEG
jgi:hypothetical protein